MNEMIRLTELTREHLPNFYEWLNDEEVIKYSLTAFQKINAKSDIDKWFDSVLESRDMNKAIVDEESGLCIGYAGISGISTVNRSGEYFIFIGDKKFWGKGFGTEVTRKVIDFGFDKLKLNRIMLTVSDENVGGVKAYTKAGFTGEGILRQACFRDGKFHNKIIMSILRKEWEML
ncbi:MAG: GNAT family N-acetyltransferase [Marinifilaceae bacterium]